MVEAEEIVRVVGRLDLRQPLVVTAVGGADAVCAFILADVVDVATAGRDMRHGLARAADPFPVRVRLPGHPLHVHVELVRRLAVPEGSVPAGTRAVTPPIRLRTIIDRWGGPAAATSPRA